MVCFAGPPPLDQPVQIVSAVMVGDKGNKGGLERRWLDREVRCNYAESRQVRLDVNSEVRGNEGGLWTIDDCENTTLVESRGNAEVRCKFWS
jgi:hypothetical protein